ncbi:TIGR03915 family putative DNA repair protein [Methylovorus menthalis]|uniref:TIGR03915 family putative DNA repair protein n=1 Tax=Methylovorus menthalis TaxID=1002227 RepID=UPI001E46AE6C|nr:TIGR03915 family putative DNA repair protein [Methylovorus menthalis]MCB4811890.1 TIGR03915 family putative DNA repair protein [Methylovorus menthalis]
METVYLQHETDMEGWRDAARRLILSGVAPHDVYWCVRPAEESIENATQNCIVQRDIFSMASAESVPDSAGQAPPPMEGQRLMVSRQFVELARAVILHSSAERFGLLYRVLWRCQLERGLMRLTGDADVARLHAMAKAVGRDKHKMKAFVRFRETVLDGHPRYLAWFEPEHHIMAEIAPFFIGRFTTMDWTIMSPRMGMRWDGKSLHFLPGGKPEALQEEDASEALWLSYYRHIFNPARLKLKAMQKEMPKKYWHNLPEAELIEELIAEAGARTQAMLDRHPEVPKRKIVGYKRKPDDGIIE